jgi:AFG3 family protein
LLEKETITHDDMMDLLGPRRSEGHEAYRDYVSNRKKSTTSNTTDTNASSQKQEDEGGISAGGLTPGLACRM